MPENIQRLGTIEAPSDSRASFEGEDVFSTYGVVQDLNANGGVNSPPKYYRYDLIDSDLGTFDWVEVTDQSDIEFLNIKASQQGLITSPDTNLPPLVDNGSSTGGFRTGGSTNHPLINQAPVTVIPNTPNPNGSIGTNVIRPMSPVGGTSNALRYPFGPMGEMTSDTDYVSFQFFDYLPPFKPSGGNRGTQGTTANSNLGIKYTAYSQSIDPMNLQKANGTYYPDIVMYMPEDLGGQYGADWTGKSFNNVAVELLRTVGSSGAIDNGSYGRAVDTGVGALKALGYKAAVDAINKGLGTNVQDTDALSGVSGTILNPNTEMMYQSSTMRGFDLRFKMQARSEDESNQIKQICTTFKRAMLPTYGGEVIGKGIGPGTPTDKKPGNGNFITLPKIVRVAFMTGKDLNEYVTQYKPCAITGVDINHTPDGAWAAYKKGAPVATEIKISFKELKLIFAQEIASKGASF